MLLLWYILLLISLHRIEFDGDEAVCKTIGRLHFRYGCHSTSSLANMCVNVIVCLLQWDYTEQHEEERQAKSWPEVSTAYCNHHMLLCTVDLLTWPLTCIIHTLSYDPKCLSYKLTWKSRTCSLIIRTSCLGFTVVVLYAMMGCI